MIYLRVIILAFILIAFIVWFTKFVVPLFSSSKSATGTTKKVSKDPKDWDVVIDDLSEQLKKQEAEADDELKNLNKKKNRS